MSYQLFCSTENAGNYLGNLINFRKIILTNIYRENRFEKKKLIFLITYQKNV